MTDNTNLSGASILVVDDEQIVLNLVEDTLTDEGYEVTTTISPRKAIELVRHKTFDFILTDIRMPEMNGIELVKEIRTITPMIGVIFMTGYANLETAKQAIKEGAYDYLMKPFELSEIRQAIARAVRQKQSTTEAALSSELNKIAGLSSMMYSSGDLASLLKLSLSFAIISRGAEGGTVAYFDLHQQELIVLQASSLSDSASEVCRLPIPAEDWDKIPVVDIPGLIRDKNQYPLSSIPALQPHLDKILPQHLFLSRSAVIVPLTRGGKMLGILSLFHGDTDYDLKSSDMQLLNFISSQLAISLENLQLLEDAREAYRRLEHLQEQTIQMERMATRGQMSTEIGHELNNYLGVVIGNFQLMNMRIQKGQTGDLQRYVESIHDHLDKISRFIKNLMDYSSFTEATFVKTDINLLINRIMEFMRPQKRFREIEIAVSTDCQQLEAEVDQGLLEQVLYNLLNNAADASGEAAVKKIEVRTSLSSNDRFQLSVKDYGAGIAEDELSKVCREKFTTKESGHGIGLVVCRNIVEKHNGRISVTSAPGQGTEFTLDLPIKHVESGKTVTETA